MTDFMSAAELTSMRLEVYRTFPDVGWIDSLSQASDGEGGVTESWSAVSWTPARTGVAGTVVPYRLDPLDTRSQIDLAGMAEAKEIHYILVVEWDAPITAGTVTRFIAADGAAYHIRRMAPNNSYRIVKRCFVAEVK